MAQIIPFPATSSDPIKHVREEMLRLSSAAAKALEEHDHAAAAAYTQELTAFLDRQPAEIHQQLAQQSPGEKLLSQGVQHVLDKVLKRLLG